MMMANLFMWATLAGVVFLLVISDDFNSPHVGCHALQAAILFVSLAPVIRPDFGIAEDLCTLRLLDVFHLFHLPSGRFQPFLAKKIIALR